MLTASHDGKERMSLRRRLAACVVWMLMAPAAVDATPVRVFTTAYPPYAAADLPGQGGAVRMLRDILTAQGFSPVVEFQPWARLGAELSRGRYDLVLLAWPGDLQRHRLIGGEPWFASRLGLYVRREDWRAGGMPLADAEHLRIGIVREYAYPDALSKRSLQLELAGSDAQNLRKLVAGRIDAVALERAVGQHLLKHAGGAVSHRSVVWQEPAFAVLPIHTAVVPGRPLTARLQRALAEGLKAYKADGRHARLLRDNDLDAPP